MQFHECIQKEIQPINFLYFRTRTKVSELGRFVGIVARELYRDAIFSNLEVTGPVYWNYIGFEGDETKPFLLEISLPVAEIPLDYEGKFQLRRSEKFHCISIIHTGSWYDIPRSYERIMQFAQKNQCKVTGYNREIYVNIDFITPGSNVTEIQLGISIEPTAEFQELPLVSEAMEISSLQ
jgi:hypothetical protein